MFCSGVHQRSGLALFYLRTYFKLYFLTALPKLSGGGPIYIGIDDTDSVSGMCTTYLLTEIIREFMDYDVIGYPNLVRLNPMIPWKTRGNGALAVRLGKGRGHKNFVGRINGLDVMGYEKETKCAFDTDDARARIERLFDNYAMYDDDSTNPAYAISHRKLNPSLYREAVRTVVPIERAERALENAGAIYRGYKNKRGLIGAASAISWLPRDRTYELIAYRKRERWGTKRRLQPLSVIEMDKRYSETFNNYDFANKHVCIAPSSPCPVLFGIRADIPDRLFDAASMIKCDEEPDRMLIYESNQGTDDHLQKRKIAEAKPFECVVSSGKVTCSPHAIAGGHTIFRLGDVTGEIDCAAYEPSKGFRKIIRQLCIGDSVTVYGGVRESPRTINIEKINIRKLSDVRVKTANPMCPGCGKRMKSIGKDKGFRCAKCRLRAKPEDAESRKEKRDLRTGFYEPPASARRHLSKPLKRMGL